jgi:hypothetical protein
MPEKTDAIAIDPALRQELLDRDDPRQRPGRGAPARYPWHTCPLGGWWQLEDGRARNSCRNSWKQNSAATSGRLFEFHQDGDNPGKHICIRVR